MNCPKCGHDNREGARFCGGCAATLAQDTQCPACGTVNPPGQKFCDSCGRRLSEATPGLRPRAPEPRSYTPKHLAEKILTSRSALEGERKQVTVLFADVKGSMELAEQVDPEEWHRIMDRFFAILSEGVHRFEGTINQYTGDGIMALFGAPIAHEDHARRACYAALHLMEELRRYADDLRLNQGLNFAVRMGLNSGEVVVGKIGEDLRMDYTAQGHTVGLAARMEQIAEARSIYLTDHTAQLVEGFFRLRDLGFLGVKGVQDRLRVYELQGVGALRTRLDVSRARGFSKFVGRTDEMAALEAALVRATQGNGQVIGVVGEAGVGKSRLCYEFTERCRARGLTVTEAHGVAHGKSIPFLGVLEYLRNYFGITDQDTEQSAREKIAGKLLLLDPELGEALPLLFEFLGVPDPERPGPRMDPEARQRQLFAAMKRITHAQGRREPTLALIEDLHWIDAGSEAFLGNFVEALAGTRHLLVVNFRPEYHAGWMQKSYYQQLPLLPLGAAAITELLQDLLGADPSLAGLPHRIRERTGGNPFFIEEVVQSLIESGSLEGNGGAYRLVKPVDEVAIPARVQAVLAARIDRLGERDKQVLQTASVIGRTFSESILKAVAGVSDTELVASLSGLQRAEFIYEEALYPEAVYAFKHALTQEVAYRSQLTEHRGRVHAGVARAIEELYPDKLDEQAALLAHHWHEAGEALQAAQWHRRAAEWAGTSHLAEALHHWQSVRAVLEKVPESAETMALGVAACTQILNIGWRLGASAEEASRIYAEGKELATRSGDMSSHALLAAMYGTIRGLGGAGTTEDYVELATEGMRLAEQSGGVGVKLALWVNLVVSLRAAGRLSEALAVVEQALAQAPSNVSVGWGIFGYSPIIFLRFFRGQVLADLGRLDEAATDLDRAVALAREHGDLETLGWAYSAHAERDWHAGNADKALDHASHAVQCAEKLGSSFSRVWAYACLGRAYLLHERWNDSAALFEQALTLARSKRVLIGNEPISLAGLSATRLACGDWSGASAAAAEALASARQQRSPGTECQAHLALGRVLLRTQGTQAEASIRAALEQASAISAETGFKSIAPFIHEELAELARLKSDEPTRQAELREARRLFTEMGATGHAERLAKELKAAQVPKRKSPTQESKAKGKAKTTGAKPGRKTKPVRQQSKRRTKT